MLRCLRPFLLTGIAAMALATQPAGAPAEVNWVQGSFQEVLAQARLKGKNVFVDFYAVWCGPCKMLEKKTYKDQRVEKLLNSLVPVKLDAEKGEGKELAEKFKVKAYPTLVLLDGEGREIDRYIGYLDADDFLATMSDYLKGINTISYFRTRLERNGNDIEALFNLGKKYADRYDNERGTKYLNHVVSLDPENRKGYTDQAYLHLGQMYYGEKSYPRAIEALTRLVDLFPDSDAADEGLILLARSYERAGNEEECLQTYRTFLRRHPDDPKAMNSFAWFCATQGIAIEEAITVAEKAVQLSQEDPGIMDTLAELYYAKGEYDRAVAIEEKASRKEPSDPYFKDQIIKFLKAALKKARQGG